MISSNPYNQGVINRRFTSMVNTSMLTMPLQSSNTFTTITTTNNFNTQCENFIDTLGELTRRYNKIVRAEVAANPNYRRSRRQGVKLAWKYEKADIEMGGKGSANWNKEERQEILTSKEHTVRGAEGHHQKNVADHPEDQADPNNIKFYKSRKEHLEKGHNGNWQNESDASKIDKEEMLKDTNKKRVIKNELKGTGIAAIIGFATGASIGFIVTIAQNGISPDTLKEAVINGGKAGLEGAAFGLVNHVAVRFVGEIATNALTGMLANWGVQITENITKACNIGVVGSIAIVTFSIYQFVKLKMNGYGTLDALVHVGKQALVSVGSLAVTILVQATFGGPAALAVSVGIGAVMLSYSMFQIHHDKKLMNKIHEYIIEKSYPTYIECKI